MTDKYELDNARDTVLNVVGNAVYGAIRRAVDEMLSSQMMVSGALGNEVREAVKDTIRRAT